MARGSWVTALGASDRFRFPFAVAPDPGGVGPFVTSWDPTHPLPASSCIRLMQFVTVLTTTVGPIEAFHATPISLSMRFRERKWHWTHGSVAKQTCIANPMRPGVDVYFAK